MTLADYIASLPKPETPEPEPTGLTDTEIIEALSTDVGAVRVLGHLTTEQGRALWGELCRAAACTNDQRSIELATLAVQSAVCDLPNGPARMAQSLRLWAIYVARSHHECQGPEASAEALRVAFRDVPRRAVAGQ